MVEPAPSLIETMVTYSSGETLPEPLVAVEATIVFENLVDRLYVDRASNLYCAFPKPPHITPRATPYTKDVVYTWLGQATRDGEWDMCKNSVLSEDGFAFLIRTHAKRIAAAAELARLDCEAE